MLADVVKGYAAATAESAADAGRTAAVVEELASFSWQIHSSDALRGALVDPQLAFSARIGIVTDLVENKVAPETLADLRFLLRVTPAADVASAIADLATFAKAPEVRSRFGKPREITRGYAERVFEELSDPADLDGVEDDLFSLARVVERERTLREAFEDDRAAVRVGVARDLFASSVRPATMRIVTQLLTVARPRNLAGTLDWLVSLVAEERGRRIAEVRSAVALDSDERDRLAASLARLTGRQVDIRVIADPEVVGGVLISVGDFMIDATVRLRLERLRDALSATA